MATTLVFTGRTAPARNGRSLSRGAVVYYAETSLPRIGIRPGDRIVVRPSGSAMVTRLLPPGALAQADIGVDGSSPTRPPCETEGCTVGDCLTCRYIDALESRLADLERSAGAVAAPGAEEQS